MAGPRMARARQQGMAILGALVVIVIVVSLASSVAMRGSHSIAATARTFEARNADGVFEALEREARRVLALDGRKEPYDAANEAWANTVLKTARDDGRGEAWLRDAQGFFNLRDIAFDADVIAQSGNQQPADEPSPDAEAEAAAASEEAALGGGVGGALAPRRPLTAGAAPMVVPSAGVGVKGGNSPVQRESDAMGMVALAAVPGVASAGAVGAGPSQGGEGLQLSPQQIAVARFSLLLRTLEIDESVLPAILDWLDTDSDERFPNGAEDDYYSRMKPPYRSANRGLTDVSELKLIRGIDDEVYAKLRPFVTVLPSATAINVNTAPAEILMSLSPAMDRATANLVIETRKVRPFRSIAEFRALPMLLGRSLVSQGLTVGSEYFKLDMAVTSGQSALAARALLARRDGDNVTLVSRDKGFFDE
jgi:type II secretory pathway component PulK